MAEEPLRIAVAGGSVSALWSGPTIAEWALVCAPGAGSNLRDPFGAYAAGRLEEAGIGCLRFQFPYSEAGRRAPDRPPLLEAAWLAALEVARPRADRLVAGGRSMGGRIASLAAAGRGSMDALALFAYPLHPPGRPEGRRDAHFSSIDVPTLFCSGDRDSFATIDELAEAAALVPRSRIHVLAGADHGFAVLKSSGRTREAVWAEAVDALLELLNDV